MKNICKLGQVNSGRNLIVVFLFLKATGEAECGPVILFGNCVDNEKIKLIPEDVFTWFNET